MTNHYFEVAGQRIRPRSKVRISVPFGELPLGNPVQIPIVVVHGKNQGPVLWVNAALHGDELNGVEIVRRLLDLVKPSELTGTIIAIPIVNAHGFLTESRYLPDRRDLNRSFPGTSTGSLASRLAKWFMTEIVAKCDYGIDLHTGSDHRTNHPQIRADLQNGVVRDMAHAFQAPVLIHSKTRSGSLRAAASKHGIPVLVYEGGEILRFNQNVIETGVEGVLRIISHLGMYEFEDPFEERSCIESYKTVWVRAKRSGLFRFSHELGDHVTKGEKIGVIEDILSGRYRSVKSSCDGIIIGALANPLVYQGDAIVHIAQVDWET